MHFNQIWKALSFLLWHTFCFQWLNTLGPFKFQMTDLISRSFEASFSCHITWQFARHMGSRNAGRPVKFQNDETIRKSNLVDWKRLIIKRICTFEYWKVPQVSEDPFVSIIAMTIVSLNISYWWICTMWAPNYMYIFYLSQCGQKSIKQLITIWLH